jgi:CDP-diacylglycerol--glycerol-3-phosphate 3-phosphatidyltransferase/cardiolipin synthase
MIRILLIPLILLFLIPLPVMAATEQWNSFLPLGGRLVAFILFGLASLTDLIDGNLARRLGLVTTLGKFLDPIADKMLVVSVLIVLVQNGRVHALIAIMVIIREFVITGIRVIAADHGVVIAAGPLGKAKTVSQIVALLLILAEPILILYSGPAAGRWIRLVDDAALLVAVALTVISGVDYLLSNKQFLKE